MDGNVRKGRKPADKPTETTTQEYNGYKITVEPPNAVNSLHRVIVSMLHGTHVKEWIEGESGIDKAKVYIDAQR